METLKPLVGRAFPKLSSWTTSNAKAGSARLTGSGLQALTLALNQRLADDARRSSGSGNLVFSPLSVYAALSLVAAGARERTLTELLGVLGAPSRDDLAGHVRTLAEQALADQSQTGGPHVRFVCGVWHDKTRALSPAYRDAAVESYKAETRVVDFREKPEEAGKQINGWVAASTNKLITSILEPGALSKQTDLVLANAIYFKGKWQNPFSKGNTKDDKFHRLDGSTVDVPFMRSWGTQHIACHDGFKVLQLQYERSQPVPAQLPPARYSMCIFLPDARDGLWRLVDKMACTPDFLREHLPTSKVPVGDFRLPKFKLTYSKSMPSVLRDMGVREAFVQGKADLSDMMVEDEFGRTLTLQEVLHKAVIEVNEEGTEAAAVTACVMLGCSRGFRPPPVLVDFVADHPFAFFVIEKVSGAIVFAGHVLDPSRS